eukprot:10196-Eustigmatos_ZCMA.PRE.1
MGAAVKTQHTHMYMELSGTTRVDLTINSGGGRRAGRRCGLRGGERPRESHRGPQRAHGDFEGLWGGWRC